METPEIMILRNQRLEIGLGGRLDYYDSSSSAAAKGEAQLACGGQLS